MKDFSAFLYMRQCKNWAHKILSWKDLFCHFFPEQRGPHSCSPPRTPFRGCWKSAAAAAHDLSLVEVDGKCQFVVDRGRKAALRGLVAFKLRLIKEWGYNGILLSHKKKRNWVICSEVDGPRVGHTEWSKSEREKQIQYANTYIWNLRKKKRSWRT